MNGHPRGNRAVGGPGAGAFAAAALALVLGHGLGAAGPDAGDRPPPGPPDARAAMPVAGAAAPAGSAYGSPAQPPQPPVGPPGEPPGPPVLTRRVSEDAGSAEAPLLFGIGIHVEPQGAVPSALVGDRPEVRRPPGPPRPPGAGMGPAGAPPGERPRPGLPPGPAGGPRPPWAPDRPPPNYNDPPYFRRTVGDLGILARMVERRGGRLTVQVQTPFTRVAAESGETVLADLEKRGHEIALHFHEDAHLGRPGERLPAETWTAVMKEELDLIRRCGVRGVRYWSGGNLYPGLLGAASAAGLDVMSDYKNPRTQRTDPRLMTVHPWRPAGGPSADSLDAFAAHDPAGKVVYLPDGIYASADFSALKRAGGDAGYFDRMTEGLENSLRAARKDRVNVFHLTVHPGEFRGVPRDPYGIVERWLAEVIDPLTKAGKVRWATFSEMADAYARWEKDYPGADPRGGPAGPTTKAGGASPAAPAVPDTFFAIHCEAGSRLPPLEWQERYWPALGRLVELADRYGARLTLMFNPQWAEYVLADPGRFATVKAWQKAGHEVALHYHTLDHGDWCGYTNREDRRADPRYRGTVDRMMDRVEQLAAPEQVLTACCGLDAGSRQPPASAAPEHVIDPVDFPEGIVYDVDGITDGLARPLPFTFKGTRRLHLRHHFLNPGRPESLDRIRAEFARAGSGEVLGVVTHEGDFAQAPDFIEEWLKFTKGRGAAVRTVRDIARQAEATAPAPLPTAPAPRAPSAPEARAGAAGDAPRGGITFVLNVHDTRHVHQSAETVTRAVRLFQKHGVRGDFYLTAPIVERYAAERPDVIALLKETGQRIRYHVRPPYPIHGGFDWRLRGLDDAALADRDR